MEIRDTYEVDFTFLNEIRLLKEILESFEDVDSVNYQNVLMDICSIYQDYKHRDEMVTLEFYDNEYYLIQEVLIDAHNDGIGYDLDNSENSYFFKSLCDLFDVTDVIETLDCEIEAVEDLDEDEYDSDDEAE